MLKMSKKINRNEALKDKSDFSIERMNREWKESVSTEFDINSLDPKNTVFLRKMNHPTKGRTLQINLIPQYPPLECEADNCEDLAAFVGFILPGPIYAMPNYVGFEKDDVEHKVEGTVSLICTSHLDEFINIFMNYRDAH